eukprot:SAG11_NODE_637_length_8033_cov_4.585707_3_plen_52_part_00
MAVWNRTAQMIRSPMPRLLLIMMTCDAIFDIMMVAMCRGRATRTQVPMLIQ